MHHAIIARKTERERLEKYIGRLASKPTKSFSDADAVELGRVLDEHAAIAPWAPDDTDDVQVAGLRDRLYHHDLKMERLAKLMTTEGSDRFRLDMLENYEAERTALVMTLDRVLTEDDE